MVENSENSENSENCENNIPQEVSSELERINTRFRLQDIRVDNLAKNINEVIDSLEKIKLTVKLQDLTIRSLDLHLESLEAEKERWFRNDE